MAKVFDSCANPNSSLSIKSGIEKIKKETSKGELTRGDTTSSEVNVNEKDYYQIRFESEAAAGRSGDPENGNATDDEDVPCAENDFMSEKEFDHAHRTDVEGVEAVPAVDINVRNSSVDVDDKAPEDDKQVSEEEELDDDKSQNTESVHESAPQSPKAHGYDPNLRPSGVNRCKKSDAVFGTRLQGAILTQPRFLGTQPDDRTEEISNISDLDKDDPMTDHEHMSGPEEDADEPSAEDEKERTEYSLPKETRKVTRMTETEDGKLLVSEEQVELVKEEVSMDQFLRETENASPVSDHVHLTEDEMDDIPRDFSLANPVDMPYLKKEFEERRRSSVGIGCKHSKVLLQLTTSSRKNSITNADIIRTQIVESGLSVDDAADNPGLFFLSWP